MTQAKRAREQALRERRERKQEKKQARADAAASERTDGGVLVEEPGVVASPLARGRLDCRAGATVDASAQTKRGVLRKRLAALQREPVAWLWATAAMGLAAYLGLLILLRLS
jgi:hypothetical protein